MVIYVVILSQLYWCLVIMPDNEVLLIFSVGPPDLPRVGASRTIPGCLPLGTRIELNLGAYNLPDPTLQSPECYALKTVNFFLKHICSCDLFSYLYPHCFDARFKEDL